MAPRALNIRLAERIVATGTGVEVASDAGPVIVRA